ncbi:unnamed protein product [Sphagnum tenellum]
MDFRGTSGPKRARTESSRGDGDWTCPQCGNVNFAFRTTCNMRKCGTAKPSESTQREMGVHMGPALYGQPSASIYMGSPGGTPPLTLGLPSNYGAPILMQQRTPNNVPYDYSSSISNVTSYNPPPPRPAAYAPPGTVIGGGDSNLPGFKNQFVLVNCVLSEVGPKCLRVSPDGVSEGDWLCPKCGNSNFAFRSTCNMRKCGAAKPTEVSRHGNGPPARLLSVTQGPPPDGSWTCESCGNVNYPFRTKCNRRNCGADKPTESKPSVNSSAQVLASDQVCGVSDCKLHQVNMEISVILLVLGVGVFWMIIVYWTTFRCSMISALSISALNGIVVLLLLLFVAVSTHSLLILSFGGEFNQSALILGSSEVCKGNLCSQRSSQPNSHPECTSVG